MAQVGQAAVPDDDAGVRLLDTLRWSWRRVGLVALLVAVAAAALSTLLPSRWSSEVTAQISPRRGIIAPGQSNSSPEDSARVLQNQALVVLSDPVVRAVATTLGRTPEQVRADVTVTTSADADSITIKASGDTATAAQTLAQDLATTWAAQVQAGQRAELATAAGNLDQAIGKARADAADPASSNESRDGAQERLRALERSKADLQTQQQLYTSPVSVLDGANVPTASDALSPAKAGAIGLVLGLGLGAVLALTRATRLRPLREVDEIGRAAQLPVVAVAPHVADLSVDPGDPAHVIANLTLLDLARALADAVEADLRDREARPAGGRRHTGEVVLVTGPGRYTGRTVTARQLAVGLVRSAHRVLLVDTDLRSATSAETTLPGLTDALAAALAADPHPAAAGSDVEPGSRPSPTIAVDRLRGMVGVDEVGVAHLGVGTVVAEGPDLIRSRALAAVLGTLCADYDVIVLDGPPLEAPESRALLRAADATLLTVGTEDLGRNTLVSSGSLLRQTRVLGMVVVDTGAVVESARMRYDQPVQDEPARPAGHATTP